MDNNWNNWRQKTDWEKWQFLRDVPAKDAEQPEIQAMASNLWAVACASPYPKWAFVQLAQCVARDLIRYVSDLDQFGREQIDGFTDPYVSSMRSIERGTDDCDAKARAFVALCLARGLRAEMVTRPSLQAVQAGHALTHVSAKVFVAVPYYDRKNHTLAEGTAQWLPVETILARARLAESAEHIPKEPDTGNWLYS